MTALSPYHTPLFQSLSGCAPRKEEKGKEEKGCTILQASRVIPDPDYVLEVTVWEMMPPFK